MHSWISRWQQFLLEHPSLAVSSQTDALERPSETAEALAANDGFWKSVRAQYPASNQFINLNSGAVSSSPLNVEKAFISYYQLANSIPSYYIFKFMEQGRELIREGLASLLNCSADEVTLLRNTTEALNNLIFGIELREGDEVVACKQDYSKAVSSWKQRALRDKIQVAWVDLAGVSDNNEQIVAKYVAAFTPRTKVLHLTHVINWNGQTLPVKAIIQEAKKRGIDVLLDGAHSFGLLETDMAALGCDYFVTALHKWLSGPIPSALLYVKKEKISTVWPLTSSFTPQSNKIRKFEELSIQLMPNILALGFAIEFYLQLGREYKEQRLRYLRRLWTSQLADIDAIRFNTPMEEERCCVIVNLSLADREPSTLESELLERFKIHVTTVLWENMRGIRVTPNVYNTPDDLQRFVEAMRQIV